MPNDDYDMDKKVEISADEMCNIIAKTMAEEPFDSIITKNLGMSIIFSLFGAKISAKIFCDEIKKGDAENAD
jgi:hypothetical protein|nr:MAG TPA: hypothetical protein [Caudoviricetes sp.]